MKNYDDDDSVEIDSVISEEKDKESFRCSVINKLKKSNSMHVDELKLSNEEDLNEFNITDQIEEMQK